MNDLSFRIADLHLAEIQLLHLFFYFRAVADGENDDLLRENVFLRHGLSLLGGHGINALRQIRIVVERQVVSKKVRETPRGVRASFEAPWQRARDRIL